MTPTLTHHARARCVEMGISTKVAKRIVQDPCVTRPSNGTGESDAVIAVNDAFPAYAVVFVRTGDAPRILTVVFRTTDDYVRDGAVFRSVPGAETPSGGAHGTRPHTCPT